MKEGHTGRATRAALQSATSTWRAVARNGRPPIRIAVGHLAKEQKLDDALDEYCQLREQDRSLTASQFCNRYPSYRQSLRRLIDVHDAMDQQPALEEANWPEIFSEFLGYEIIHELGVGAIARVYLAAETALGGRLVAIKVSQQGGDEAETLGKLTHPNVVPVFSIKYDKETEMTAVCMPYHGSATLADLLEIGFESGTPPTTAQVILDAAREREQVVDFVDNAASENASDPVLLHGSYVDGVVRLGIQLAEALAYTHEHGILHRDLKPSNVLLTPVGVPMLLDFNLASDIEGGARRLGGTLPYMPPEQIRDVHLQPYEADLSGDPRSDIFSLGVILYELLTGKLPFGDPPVDVVPRQAAEACLKAQEETPAKVNQLNPAVGQDIANIVARCLALDIDERPATAAELSADLEKYFSRSRRIGRWTSRHRRLVATVVSVLTITTLLIVLHLATRPPYHVRQYRAGVAEIAEGSLDAAIGRFDRAVSEEGDQAHLLFARGVAYQIRGDDDRAILDLKRAADKWPDPIVLECCAYSELRHASAADVVAARTRYVAISQSEAPSPELELNLSYTYYVGKRMPQFIIQRTSIALELRPNWQPALYLRALGHYQLAKDATSAEQRAKASEASVQDFEKAISVATPSARLYYDAACAYRPAPGELPTTRFIELVRLAADQGASRQAIMSLGSDEPWVNSEWFRRVLAKCGTDGEFLRNGLDEIFVTRPSQEAIFAALTNPQTMDFAVSPTRTTASRSR